MEIIHNEDVNYFKIDINGVLHLSINKKELINIRSWYVSEKIDPDPYFIELTYKTNKVICQYDSRIKWETILYLLSKI